MLRAQLELVGAKAGAAAGLQPDSSPLLEEPGTDDGLAELAADGQAAVARA